MTKHAPENITVEYTPAGFEYVRRILGQRPYDEAGPVIYEMERMKAEQTGKVPTPQGPAAELPAGLLEAVAAGLKGNGAASPPGGA